MYLIEFSGKYRIISSVKSNVNVSSLGIFNSKAMYLDADAISMPLNSMPPVGSVKVDFFAIYDLELKFISFFTLER
uniref:Uncharacterized protein n=1 Tax=Lepeophtheirus salmonis TaxID=72036 RepID=A0A0K2TN21_LEPSM